MKDYDKYIRTLKVCPFCNSNFEFKLEKEATVSGMDKFISYMFSCPVHDADNLEFGVWGWATGNDDKEIWALNIIINNLQFHLNTHDKSSQVLKRITYDEDADVIWECKGLIEFPNDKDLLEKKMKTITLFS